jgi:DNA (cytosine-5)-methyltransferase 1
VSLRFLSVCSGIEAASVAWSPLGWKAWAFSEIEAFPSAVLKHHYPDTPNLGDMTCFKDWPDASIDLLCGGTPCQSFSNAGLRAGLDDPRGQLMLTFGVIAARYRPRWLVWENVPGVLSSNEGRDFGAFLGLLGFLGYGFAYRVLDAQFVRVDGHGRAVPQRRNRVFVVGFLRDWRSAAAVLLERESLRGDPAPRRQAGARVAGALKASTGRGGADDNDGQAGKLIAATLDANYGRLQGCSGQDAKHGHSHLIAYGGNNTGGPREVASALSAHGGTGRHDFETETFIAHAPEVHATMTARSSRGGGQTNSPGHNADESLVAYAFDARQSDVVQYGDKAGPLDTDAFSQAIAFDPTQITSRENRTNPQPGGPCHTLAKGMHAPAIATTARVRRLMPLECERLMGFPDNYTLIPVVQQLLAQAHSGCRL